MARSQPGTGGTRPAVILLRTVPVLAVMAGIFFCSHQPGDSFHLPSPFALDKIAHFCAYFLLALTIIWCVSPGDGTKVGRVALISFLSALLFGFSDEFHQSFIPHRSVSLMDIVADGLGGGLAAVLWSLRQDLRDRQAALYRYFLTRI
ncbi:MAG: VanZ family protein [Thermodesulfobacteriota bacterium]